MSCDQPPDRALHPALAAGSPVADPPGDDAAGADGTTQPSPVEAAHAAALASLPGIGPATLARILAERSPTEAWAEVRAGRILRPLSRGVRTLRARGVDSGVGPPGRDDDSRPLFEIESATTGSRTPAGRSWADFARRIEPVEWWNPHLAAGIRVTWRGGPLYPRALVDDPEPPGVLFWRGRTDCLDAPCVAIVGTRNATPDGRRSAFELGRDLAAAGVCVVSGLALGIDGAAHAGALAALREGVPSRPGSPGAAGRPGAPGRRGGTVGIAASGVDVPYPRRHTTLWRDVSRIGAILSETPPGRPAQAWRFPSRNRIIAGLASMVVVVESHMQGGSLITAEAALQRGVEVRVVPGPVHSPASAGSNQLLYDGPGPVRNARDVLDALGDLRPDPAPSTRRVASRGNPRPAPNPPPPAPGPPGRRHPPTGPHQQPTSLDTPAGRVLNALGWRPASTNQLMARTGLDAATTHAALEGLMTEGCVTIEGGWWARTK